MFPLGRVGAHDGLQLLPLVRSEHLPDSEEHAGIGFFKVSAGLCDGIDLAEDLRLVELVGFEHGAKENLLFLKRGVQVDQPKAMLLEDIVHLLLLVVGEADLLGDARIVPPAVLGDAKGVFHWRSAYAVAISPMPVLGKGGKSG